MRYKIGVVIATYNGEKYIQEQLESIFSQTLKPDLIVVSDGGSTDSTVEICQKTLKKSGIKHLVLESDKKLSVKDNFEKGFKNCETKYIFFSDQDDYWLPNKLKNAVYCHEKNHAIVVFCNALITDKKLKVNGKTLWQVIGYKPKKEETVYERYDQRLQKELIKHGIMTGMCMSIDSDIKKEILPFSEYTIHDSWIALLSSTIGRVASINSCDVYYRQHGNNAIGTKSTIRSSLSHKNAYLLNVERRYKLIKELLKKIDNDNYAKGYAEYLKHLYSRIQFIKGKNTPHANLTVRKYYRYNHKPLQIIGKDIYSKMSYNKKTKHGQESNN